ncbi:MAG: hypothetical protein RLZZ50_1405, partial [Verrucomicrobiota bacterium]
AGQGNARTRRCTAPARCGAGDAFSSDQSGGAGGRQGAPGEEPGGHPIVGIIPRPRRRLGGADCRDHLPHMLAHQVSYLGPNRRRRGDRGDGSGEVTTLDGGAAIVVGIMVAAVVVFFANKSTPILDPVGRRRERAVRGGRQPQRDEQQGEAGSQDSRHGSERKRQTRPVKGQPEPASRARCRFSPGRRTRGRRPSHRGRFASRRRSSRRSSSPGGRPKRPIARRG